MQMVTAMDHLMQFAFNFNAASSHFARDFSGLTNKNFLSSQFAVNSTVDGRFLGDIQSTLESNAVTDHEVIGLIHIGCHVRLSFKNFRNGMPLVARQTGLQQAHSRKKLQRMLTPYQLRPIDIVSQRFAGLVS